MDAAVRVKKRRGQAVKLRKILAFTYRVEEVKAQKEIEELSELDCTGQEQ